MAAIGGAASAGAKGLSLHVGLNYIDPAHYGGSNGELKACINDAEAMQQLALAQGFEVMGVLRDAQGTRGAVKAAFAKAAAQLKSGDMFFFTYSGHGSYVPDLNLDEAENDALDKFDETWCLYDGMLIDDEVYQMWQAFAPGVRVSVLLDCCHSGSAIKAFLPGPGGIPALRKGKPRALPTSVTKKTFMSNLQMYKDIEAATAGAKAGVLAGDLACSVKLISGCQDKEVSIDGWPNGVFTEQLLAAWNGGAFAGSHKDFHDLILTGMPWDQQPNLYTIGAPNPGFDGQKPFTL